MNNSQIFLSTNVEGSGLISGLGNVCLAPVRYFFHGRTIKIVPKDALQEVHHVRSFHKNGDWNCSETDFDLESSGTSFLKTVSAIIFLIPGLCLGAVFKGLSYLSKSTRDQHELVKQHFTPINKTIGSAENPLDESQMQDALNAIRQEPLHQKINALTIYGKDVQLNTDPGFVKLNPKKVIFVGARIVHQPCGGTRLDDTLFKNKKWINYVRDCTEKTVGDTFVTQFAVGSVDEALNHQTPRMSWSFKRYHGLYVVTQ